MIKQRNNYAWSVLKRSSLFYKFYDYNFKKKINCDNMNINSFYVTRKTLFTQIEDSTTTFKILMSILMACLTGIMAQILIPLPFTPVPITAQTFAVLTAGLVLGKKYGALSQIFYIIAGILFIPWFNGATGGIEVLLGSTGGYLIGFVLASYFIGYIKEKGSNCNFKKMTLFTSIATFGLIYIPGLIGLATFTYFNQGILLSIPQLLVMGLVPFLIGDIVKILAASSVSKVFLPKN